MQLAHMLPASRNVSSIEAIYRYVVCNKGLLGALWEGYLDSPGVNGFYSR